MIHHDKFLHLHIQHLTLPSILENSGIVIKLKKEEEKKPFDFRSK